MGPLIAPGWWRRNLLPLVAMLVAAAATVVVGVIVPLQNDQAVGVPARRAAADHDIRFRGVTVRLTKAGVFHPGTARSVDVPKGAMILAVLIRIRSRSLPTYSCSVSLLHDGTDDISWQPLSDPAQYRYGLSDSTQHYCSLDAGGTQTLEQTFLVPDDVYRHVLVQVRLGSTIDGWSSSVALELPAKPYSDRAG